MSELEVWEIRTFRFHHETWDFRPESEIPKEIQLPFVVVDVKHVVLRQTSEAAQYSFEDSFRV